MICYPVLIPTLNRYEHFKRCVESLLQNTHADKTELVIGLDCPPSEKYVEGYNKIKAYIPTISGFAKVTVFERTTNLGASKNLNELEKYAFSKYEAVIMTEDDNEFSPCFLDFMNKALVVYMHDESISSVSGYSRPEISNADYNSSLVFSYNSSAWGIGIWRDKEIVYECKRLSYFEDLVKDNRKTLSLLRNFPIALLSLIEMLQKGVLYGDTKRSCINIIEGKYQVTPKLSMVRNYGHDGSGINGGSLAKDPYSSQRISENVSFDENNWEYRRSKYVEKSLRRIGMPKYRILGYIRILFKTIQYRVTH